MLHKITIIRVLKLSVVSMQYTLSIELSPRARLTAVEKFTFILSMRSRQPLRNRLTCSGGFPYSSLPGGHHDDMLDAGDRPLLREPSLHGICSFRRA